ncbi:unnamed protein product [Camellia sinensis]
MNRRKATGTWLISSAPVNVWISITSDHDTCTVDNSFSLLPSGYKWVTGSLPIIRPDLKAFLGFHSLLSIFSHFSSPRKCLAAEETVDAALAAAAAAAVEVCKNYPDMSYSEKTTTETLIVGLAPKKTNSLRELRWVRQLRMVASVELTAPVTLAPANETQSKSSTII